MCCVVVVVVVVDGVVNVAEWLLFLEYLLTTFFRIST